MGAHCATDPEEESIMEMRIVYETKSIKVKQAYAGDQLLFTRVMVVSDDGVVKTVIRVNPDGKVDIIYE